MTKPIIVGIDPAYAKPVAIAWYVSRVGWLVHSVEIAETAALQDILRHARMHGAAGAVIEDGFVGVNRKVGMGLAAARERIKIACEMTGLPVRMVYPATWQASMLSQGKWRPKTHAEIAKQAKLRALGETGSGDLTEDESCAVCIAAWGAANWEGE